jgi:membrane associated rhomboid family serine protease
MEPYLNKRQVQFGFINMQLTSAIKRLLIANGVVYALQMIFGSQFNLIFALHPALVFKKFFIWQFGTYMFLHDGFFHIFFNMLMLWMFGSDVERSWGSKEFLKYYFICGISAGLLQLLLKPAWVVGASGAVYGVLIAFVLLHPDRQLMFFPFFISLKAKYWAMIFAGISILMGVWEKDQVAHFAHLGGMAVGFVYTKFGQRLFSNSFVSRKKSEIKQWKGAKKQEQILRLRKEVDAILDKINEVGYENLSDRDLQILQEASKVMAHQNNNDEK